MLAKESLSVRLSACRVHYWLERENLTDKLSRMSARFLLHLQQSISAFLDLVRQAVLQTYTLQIAMSAVMLMLFGKCGM